MFFKFKIAINIAALTTAMSATLKIGQCGSCRKSITSPCNLYGGLNMRSDRFPKTPPNAKPIAIDHHFEITFAPKYKITNTIAIAKPERKIVPELAKLNAAPEFFANLNCKSFPITGREFESKELNAQALVA